jgi:Domain of unknown function (DUF305)
VNATIYHLGHRGRRMLAIMLVGAAGSLFVALGREHAPIAADAHAGHGDAPAEEAEFVAENDAAMDKMMADMTIKPSGDIDRDFVAMMAPHHQGAIDMALILLRHGKNEQLKRLAQEIIVTQQQEIAAMRLAIGDLLPPSIPAPTQVTPAPPSDHPAASTGAMQMSPRQMDHMHMQ